MVDTANVSTELDKALPADDPTRQLAEKTATKFDIKDILLKGYGEQTFSITPDIKVTMRTISSGVVDALLACLEDERANTMLAVRFEELLRQHYVTASLQALGDRPLTPDLDALVRKGESLDTLKKSIKDKLNLIRPLSWSLVALLYAHYLLFEERFKEFLRSTGVNDFLATQPSSAN
jgi:hypothetical protein